MIDIIRRRIKINKEEKMNRKYLAVTIVMLSCVLMVALSSCDLITTDKDRFFVNEDNYLKKIDIEKTGPDIVVPEKVGDNVIRNISLYSPYYSKINSIDVSNVSELEFFKIKLFEEGANSKLKKLDFSKNKKLKYVILNSSKGLEEIIFNENCRTISLYNTSVKELDLNSVKKLKYFDYINGPLEELDISNNPNLEIVEVYNTNVKALDVSRNPKLRRIEVDEGTEIIGETNAEIKYWTKEDIEKWEELRKND